MDACYTAVITLLCSLFHAANAQDTVLSVEAWAAIGLIGGIVALIIGLVWIVFCIMLYRHHKERQGDDGDSNEEKERKDKQQKKKQKQRKEQLNQQREIESVAIESSEVPYCVHSLPLEDQDQANGSTVQAPMPTSPHTESPPDSAPGPEPVQQTEEDNATEPPNDNPNPVPPSTSSPSPKPSDSVPSTFQSLFTPPALALEPSEADHELQRGGGSHTGGKLHAHLPNVSSSRLRKLSDVEECDVQPQVSNFPLRYGQRRPSSASRKLSDNSDPFSFFNFEPSLLGRSNSEKRDIQYVYGGPAKIERNPMARNYQDHMFGQLGSWPEFN